MGAEGYRARLHSALTMEEVLVRHPRLRVYLMHAGYPMIDDLLTLLYAHPQVHVDVGVIVYTQPRTAFYRYLERIVEAGFVKPDHVRLGPDGLAGDDRAGGRGDRGGAVPLAGARSAPSSTTMRRASCA